MVTNVSFDEIYKSRWLKASDIPGDDLLVMIKDVKAEEVGADKELKLVLEFVEIEKQLILNKTNAKVLADRFGKNTSDWVGRRIALYSTEVDFAGKVTLAIRVRLKTPVQPSTPPEPPASPAAPAMPTPFPTTEY